MPIPSNGFKGEVSLFGEVAFGTTDGDDYQHDSSYCHVQAMESSQHEKSCAVNTRI